MPSPLASSRSSTATSTITCPARAPSSLPVRLLARDRRADRLQGSDRDAYPSAAPISAPPGSRPDNGGVPGTERRPGPRQVLDAVERRGRHPQLRLRRRQPPQPGCGRRRSPARSTTGRSRDGSRRSRACAPRSSCRSSPGAWRPREIERVGSHPGFVQVSCRSVAEHPTATAAISRSSRPPLRARSGGRHPLRRRARQPADRGRLAVLLRRRVRRHGPVFQSQLISLIVRGRLRPASRAAGRPDRERLHLAAGAMWRFDKEWKGLRREVPWVRARPVRVHPRARALDAPAARRAARHRQLLQIRSAWLGRAC